MRSMGEYGWRPGGGRPAQPGGSDGGCGFRAPHGPSVGSAATSPPLRGREDESGP